MDKPSVHVVDVEPKGWRRTVNGWERAERWAMPAGHPTYNLHQWIALERSRQPSLARAVLEGLRQIHPLTFSLSLLATVLGIVSIHHRRSVIRERQRPASAIDGRHTAHTREP